MIGTHRDIIQTEKDYVLLSSSRVGITDILFIFYIIFLIACVKLEKRKRKLLFPVITGSF